MICSLRYIKNRVHISLLTFFFHLLFAFWIQSIMYIHNYIGVKLDPKIFLRNYFGKKIQSTGLQNVEYDLSYHVREMSPHSKHLVNIEGGIYIELLIPNTNAYEKDYNSSKRLWIDTEIFW